MVVVEVADGVTATVKTMVVEQNSRATRAVPRARRRGFVRGLGTPLRQRNFPSTRKARRGADLGRGPRLEPTMATVDVTTPRRGPSAVSRRTTSRPSSRCSARSSSRTRRCTALVIEEGLRPGGLLPRRAPRHLRRDARPVHEGEHDRRPHRRRAPQAGRAARGGRRRADDRRAGRRRAGRRQRPPLRADRARERAPAPAAAAPPTRSSRSVPRTRAPPRELVDSAERAILEVAHDDRRKDFRSIDDVLHDELDKLQQLSREGTAITGTPSGLRRPRRPSPAASSPAT